MEDNESNENAKKTPDIGPKTEGNGPRVDVISLIRMIAEVASGNQTPKQAAQAFAKPVWLAATVYARDTAAESIERGFFAMELQSLNRDDFAKHLVDESVRVGKIIRQYMIREIDEQEMVKKLGGGEIREMTEKVLSALGIDSKLGLGSMSEVMKLSPLALAFTASAAAYKELRKALDDRALAERDRIRTEAACRESIALIRQYRQEMERVVDQYLTTHLETFESGFAAMDKALMENDIDGYIKGNAEIQAILGYRTQFANQSEFDQLMDSDDAFRL